MKGWGTKQSKGGASQKPPLGRFKQLHTHPAYMPVSGQCLELSPGKLQRGAQGCTETEEDPAGLVLSYHKHPSTMTPQQALCKW